MKWLYKRSYKRGTKGDKKRGFEKKRGVGRGIPAPENRDLAPSCLIICAKAWAEDLYFTASPDVIIIPTKSKHKVYAIYIKSDTAPNSVNRIRRKAGTNSNSPP